MSLSAELEELENWVERLPSIGMRTLGGAGAPMFVLDFIMIGAAKRSLSLGIGLIGLIKSKNMVCSRAILRMQLDTITRLLAYTYVEDPEAMAREVIGGKKLAKFKSRDGKQLRDGYLVDKMTENHPWVRNVYDFTSGYVHFSESQFFDSIQSTGSDEERTVQIQISHIDDKYSDFSWTEVVACFNRLLKILEGLLDSYSQDRKANK